jgi:hypothetical protein
VDGIKARARGDDVAGTGWSLWFWTG